MGARLIKIAVCYLILGMGMGIFMGASKHFEYAGVHAHVNLLGWATMALAGLVYAVYPAAGKSALAMWHFWLHNIGLPLMAIGMFGTVQGTDLGWLIGVGGGLTTLGMLLFLVNIFKNVKDVGVSAPSAKDRDVSL